MFNIYGDGYLSMFLCNCSDSLIFYLVYIMCPISPYSAVSLRIHVPVTSRSLSSFKYYFITPKPHHPHPRSVKGRLRFKEGSLVPGA